MLRGIILNVLLGFLVVIGSGSLPSLRASADSATPGLPRSDGDHDKFLGVWGSRANGDSGLDSLFAQAVAPGGTVDLAAGYDGRVQRFSPLSTDSFAAYLPVINPGLIPVIPDTTVVLTDTTLDDLISISTDGAVFTFSKGASQLDELDPGHVIVGDVSAAAPQGFLRRVTGVSEQDRTLSITTEQATLAEAIDTGQIQGSRRLVRADIQSAILSPGTLLHASPGLRADVHYQFDGAVVYDGAAGSVVIDGGLTLDATFDYRLVIIDGQLDELSFTCTADHDSALDVTWNVIDYAIHPDPKVIAKHTFSPVTFFVGRLPVVIVPEVTLKVGADGHVYASATAGTIQRASLVAGLRYANQEWTPITSYSSSFRASYPTWSEGADIHAYMRPELDIKFYGAVGPHVGLEAHVQLHANIDETPQWALYGGMQAPIGIAFDVLDKALSPYETVVIEERRLLAQAELDPLEAVYLGGWGSGGSGEGQFWGPYSVAVAPDGTVYVADMYNHRVQRFSATGTFLGAWGSYGSSKRKFDEPRGVAVAPDGTVYVTDSRNDRVQRFSATGTFLTKWGSEGSGDGQFWGPKGVAVAPDSTVYVTDWPDHAVQRFTATGTFLGKWGSEGSGDGQFQFSRGVAVAPDGTVYVADQYNQRVQYFSAAGAFLGKWGSYGSVDGQFKDPQGVAVAPDGTVYVRDYGNCRVQRFSATGAFLGKWGSPGSGAGQIANGFDVAVAADGTVYVPDFFLHRVQYFRVLDQQEGEGTDEP